MAFVTQVARIAAPVESFVRSLIILVKMETSKGGVKFAPRPALGTTPRFADVMA
jgi:hypothetical protein